MALRTSVAVEVSNPVYDKLHMRECIIRATGETDVAGFNLRASFRRYAVSEDGHKYWMDLSQDGALINIRVDNLETWAEAQVIAGNMEAAQAIGVGIAAVQSALAAILAVEKANVVGSVEVV